MESWLLWNSTPYSFRGGGVTPRAMLGLGRAAMPQLGAGRGHRLLSSFPPGHVESISPASEPPTAQHSPPFHAGRCTSYEMNRRLNSF